MIPTKYNKVKVNNEIELCKVTDENVKAALEKALLSNRISYFIRWEKASLFSDRKAGFIFCVNEWQVEPAELAIGELPDEMKGKIKFVRKKIDKTLF